VAILKKAKALAKAAGVAVYCSHSAIEATEKLQGNPRNPNTHPQRQVELLARIIEYQGWRAPITVSTRSGFIVRGHGRLAAAMLRGWEQVPVDYQDYASEAEEWADMVADNRVAELAEIDPQLLKDVLQEIDTGEIDLELTAYRLEEIESMMLQVYTPPADSPGGSHAGGGEGHERPGHDDTALDKGSVKDGNWFFITFYGQPDEYVALYEKLNSLGLMRTEHEISAEAFKDWVEGL
jgi:hypothetical protein